MSKVEHESDHDEKRVATFLARTAEEAEREHRQAVGANREAHLDPDPPIADPLRELQVAQRRWRKRVKGHRLRYRR